MSEDCRNCGTAMYELDDDLLCPACGNHDSEGLTMTNNPTIDPPMPAVRIRADGSKISVEDSPYELGFYYGTIGMAESENPFPRADKMSRKLFSKGWKDSKK